MTIFFDDGTKYNYLSSIQVQRTDILGYKNYYIRGGMGYRNSYVYDGKIWYIVGVSFACGLIFYLMFLRKKINTTKYKPKYWMEFKTDDLILENRVWKARLGIFDNDVVEFDTEGEFEDYLEKISIKEYPVFKIVGKKETDKQSEGFWYAEFIFSQKPLNGKLKLRFK
jgi:hypothetical protein